MTVTPTKESPPPTAPDQVEVLIKEARRRGRRHRLVVVLLVTAVLAATAVAAIVVGIGGRNPFTRSPITTEPLSTPLVPGSLNQIAFPSPGPSTFLSSISCESGSRCFVVGSRQTVHTSYLIASRYQDRHWTPISAPLLPHSANPGSLSCPTTAFCMMAGYDWTSNPKGVTRALAQVFDGHSWRLLGVPVPSGSVSSRLSSLDCPDANWCIAMGASSNGYANSVFSDLWNGKRWVLVGVPPALAAGQQGPPENGGISCVSRSWCLAVGAYAPAGDTTRMASEIWNGRAWAQIPVPPFSSSQEIVHIGGRVVSSALSQSLSGVSCVSSSSCVASGTFTEPAATQAIGGPRLLHWAGRSWQSAITPGIDNRLLHARLRGGFGAVSCVSSQRCVTLVTPFNDPFSSQPPAGTLQSDADGWFASTKSVGTAEPTLQGVSCLNNGQCLIVGWTFDPKPVPGFRDGRSYPLILIATPRS
jgi:hypothetical protein